MCSLKDPRFGQMAMENETPPCFLGDIFRCRGDFGQVPNSNQNMTRWHHSSEATYFMIAGIAMVVS